MRSHLALAEDNLEQALDDMDDDALDAWSTRPPEPGEMEVINRALAQTDVQERATKMRKVQDMIEELYLRQITGELP